MKNYPAGLIGFVLPLTLAASTFATLASATSASAELPADWAPVDVALLDQIRGGFTTPSGLEMALGFERQVLVNGKVVARSSVELADLRQISADNVRLVRDARATGGLVQIGPNNSFQAATGNDALAGIVVQNTLNDQVIRSQTVINSSVNSAAMMKAINFQDSVRSAQLAAIGQR